jgi:spore germination protein GerM
LAPPLSRWLLASTTAFVLLACGGAGTWWFLHRPVPQHLTLFYADPLGMNLVPVESTVDFVRADAPGPWAHALFERLEQPPEGKLLPAVGAKMTLVDASWMPPTWSLTVKLPDDSGTTQETLLAGSLVRSFVSSYPGAQKVRLRLLGANGKPFAAQHLDLGDPLTPAEFANQTDSAPNSGLAATLWWRSKGGAELVPVKLPLAGGSGSPPHDAFDRLLGGPPTATQTFLETVAPAGLKAQWAGLQGDVATIDLNDDLAPGSESERFVKATVLTLTEFSNIKAVRFTHRTSHVVGMVGAFDLSKPIQRPPNVNAGSSSSRPQGG